MPLLPSSKVAIVGGGISGIISALELERNGFSPVIFEKSDRLGGRLKTDFYEDIPLDHGFQVLLTHYPELKRYLDFEALDLHYFRPAALVFESATKHHEIGDAFRDRSLLLSTLKTDIASFSDKLKLLRQQRRIGRLSVAQIFESADRRPTKTVLEERYSSRFIEQFFTPFYGGIFLDKNLGVSNTHFEFVFHMFANGFAAIPKRGIESVVTQLTSRLKSTEIKLGVSISIEDLSSDFDGIIKAHADTTDRQWFGTEVFYFICPDTANPLLSKLSNTIGLFPHSDSVNTIHALRGSQSTLISASVVGVSTGASGNLEQAVRSAITDRTGLALGSLAGYYRIEKALPAFAQMKPHLVAATHQNRVFEAGDHLLYPSLNAAMTSGREVVNQLVLKKE